MRGFTFISLLCIYILGLGQSSTLLIARNTGKKILHDSVEIRSFGYAQKLSENPGMPGPTLIYTEGDSVTIDLWNVSQGAPHTIHLHGLDVNQQNDGVPHLSFDVGHMYHGFYKFKAPHPGTYLYHCHVVSAIHVQAGMYGLLIIKPKSSEFLTWEGGYSFTKEHSFMMAEVDTFWHKDSILLHDTSAHHIAVPPFNPTYFLVNGLSQNQLRTEYNELLKDENTYLRFANIGYTGNVIHFPTGFNAKIISSDGRPLPSQIVSDSLHIFPGERYGVIARSSILEVDSIRVDYVDLNTLNRLGQEYIQMETVAELNTNSLNQQGISLFPNPASSYFSVEVEQPNSLISISTLDGRIVQELRTVSAGLQKVRTEDLSNGVYLVTVKSNGFIRQSKLYLED